MRRWERPGGASARISATSSSRDGSRRPGRWKRACPATASTSDRWQPTLEKLVEALPNPRIWILIDEWSDIPVDLQPLLADFLKRSLFPVRGITVKIGAIEHRSRFRVPTDSGDYLGIELGADASANVDLDDFMVFSNDVRRAEEFFSHLIVAPTTGRAAGRRST